MLILAIETSCDETAASVIEGKNDKITELSSVISSQISLHAKWGGVVPNLAAREHLKNILPVIEEALQKAGISPKKIDLLAVTNGPGLIPALLIGVSSAKTLSYIWKKPLIGIHHVEGHIFANFIGSSSKLKTQNAKSEASDAKNAPRFPILCLVVSGGHTQLILMKDFFNYEIIGETLDDAAGEAFDKVARILGLAYPGGPEISRRASQIINAEYKLLNVSLPRPMLHSQDFNFSFSGLKTAVLYEAKKHPEKIKNETYINELSHEFQQSVVDVLVKKTIQAAKKYSPKTICLAGGVSANEELRKQMELAIKKDFPEVSYFLPNLSHSLDNAAMIGAAAYFRFQKMNPVEKKELEKNWRFLEAKAGLKLN